MRRPRLPRVRRPGPPGRSLLAVLALLAVGVGASVAVPSPADERPAGPAALRSAAVDRAVAVCPEPFAEGRTDVGVAAPGRLGRDRPGRAVLTPLARPGDAVAEVPAGTSGSVAWTAAARSPAVVATATGGLAPGLAAAEVTAVPEGDLRGLAGSVCAPAATDFWFVGSGAEVGQRGRLYLTNPEAAPAQVDVTLYGPAGEIDAPAGRGVTVPARGQEVLLLDALAPAIPRFGVHVEVRSGRVAAALRDQQIRGLDPLGVDWVPVAAAPARRVVLAGVPAGEGERLLQVLAPGVDDAIVRVRLLDAEGGFVPAGLDVVEVGAGRVEDVDLAPHARGEAVAVELTSDTPVTAGLLARTGGAPDEPAEPAAPSGEQPASQPDIAYVSAAGLLTRSTPGAVALLRPAGATSELVLAAPTGPGSVRVEPVPSSAGPPVTVDLPAGAQVAVDLAAPGLADATAVLLRPDRGSAPVAAAHLVTSSDARGSLLTVLPVPPGRFAVRVPDVRPDLSAGMRD